MEPMPAASLTAAQGGSRAADRAFVRALTHRRGANFSIGFRFLPPAKRDAVYAAYAFCRWADDLADEAGVEDRPAALDAWEEELERTYAGAPRHVVSRALAAALEEFAIPKQGFADLIAGCRRDLVQRRYGTFADLERYCHEVAVSISEISLGIFRPTVPAAHEHGRHLAMGLQLTNILRDVAEDLGRDRIYLPQEELARFGVTEAALRRGLAGEGVPALLAFQADRALAHFRAARPLPGEVEADARRTVALLGAVYVGVLGEIVRRRHDVFHGRVGLSLAQKVGVIATALVRPEIVRG